MQEPQQLSSVVSEGTGCPECGREASTEKQKLTVEEYQDRIKDRSVALLDPDLFDACAVHCPHYCKECGHGKDGEWSPKPANVLSGYGCPSCAKSGYDPEKPACLYLMTGLLFGHQVFKSGESNKSPRERHGLQTFEKYGWKLVYDHWWQDGHRVSDIEADIKAKHQNDRLFREYGPEGEKLTIENDYYGILPNNGETEIFTVLPDYFKGMKLRGIESPQDIIPVDVPEAAELFRVGSGPFTRRLSNKMEAT